MNRHDMNVEANYGHPEAAGFRSPFVDGWANTFVGEAVGVGCRRSELWYMYSITSLPLTQRAWPMLQKGSPLSSIWSQNRWLMPSRVRSSCLLYASSRE